MGKINLQEGDLVLCTVKSIEGTTVFVDIENIEGKVEGTIVTSEIAPGRIRNLRDYVVPNKKIVCKILRVESSGNLHLSLRRVTAKEKREVNDLWKKEKNLEATIKSISQNPEEVIKKLKEQGMLSEFLEKSKEDPKILERIMGKEEAEKLLKVLKEKKGKEVSVTKKFNLKCEASNGINIIKEILPDDTKYLAAGKYALIIKDTNYKDANAKIDKLLKEIEDKADKFDCDFELLKEK